MRAMLFVMLVACGGMAPQADDLGADCSDPNPIYFCSFEDSGRCFCEYRDMDHCRGVNDPCTVVEQCCPIDPPIPGKFLRCENSVCVIK